MNQKFYCILFFYVLVVKFNFSFSLLSQSATPTLWDSLEEPDIRDTSEFEYLFSKDTTQQKKKPLSETYEKKNKVKKVLSDYSNHCNNIYIHTHVCICHTWEFIMCCQFAFPAFKKNVLEGFDSLVTKRNQQFENACLLFWSQYLKFQTIFPI